jgi:hypothetical protein
VFFVVESFSTTKSTKDTKKNAFMSENPPIGRTWNRLYAFVLIALAIEVALFYAFTKAFA